MQINRLPESIVVDERSVYRCIIKVSKSEKYTALKLTGKNKDQNPIINRDIKSNEEISTIFFTKEKQEKLLLKITSKCSKKIKEKELVEYFNIEKVGTTKNGTELITNKKSTCVAIATYPARRTSLIEAINSLINQADYILLYLNEYKSIPKEIEEHINRKKIICLMDETGLRRAEAKFHWLGYVNGFYLTCDDDIIYPDNYVRKTVESIEKYHRAAVVGYHGVLFKDIVVNFKSDRKEFYKFTENIKEDKPCHLLGTGVSGFHTDILSNIDYSILKSYPYAVDPAFSVICKRNNIKMYCLAHESQWIKSSPHMIYGLHEEKQSYKNISKLVDNLVQENNPWGKSIVPKITEKFKKNPKARKLINNPKQFFIDSKILNFIKKLK